MKAFVCVLLTLALMLSCAALADKYSRFGTTMFGDAKVESCGVLEEYLNSGFYLSDPFYAYIVTDDVCACEYYSPSGQIFLWTDASLENMSPSESAHSAFEQINSFVVGRDWHAMYLDATGSTVSLTSYDPSLPGDDPEHNSYADLDCFLDSF